MSALITASEIMAAPNTPKRSRLSTPAKALCSANTWALSIGVLGGGARGGISGPFFFWREAFGQARGATLEIIEIPFGEFLTTTVAGFATGQNIYDVVTPGAWFYGDTIQGKWIQPIDRVFDDPAYPLWNRSAVAPGIRSLMT